MTGKRTITQRFARILAEEQGGWFCIYCGKALPEYEFNSVRHAGSAEVDHLTPKSRGGTDDLTNLALSCVSCNSIKRSKTAHEFVLWLRPWLKKQRMLRKIDELFSEVADYG